MKTEKFEDKIRRKLESIEPEFHENDWANFVSYSAATKASIATKLISNSIFKIAASLAGIGILVFSIAQYTNNRKLENKIEALSAQNKALELKQNKLNVAIAEEKFGLNNTKKLKQDNLQTTENELINKEITFTPNKKISIENEKNFIAENNIKSQNFKNYTHKNDLNDKRQLTTYDGERAKLLVRKKFMFKLFRKNKMKENYVRNDYLNENKLAYNNKIGLYENEITVNNHNEKLPPNIINEEFELNHYNLLKNRQTSLPSKYFTKELNEKDFAYFKSASVEKKKLYFTLADAYFRTGLATSVGKGVITYGLNSEVFLDQRISITTGIYSMKHIGQAYYNTMQYKNKTHADFKEKYKGKVPPTREVLSINEKTDLLVIPAHLNYNHPISTDFQLVGTIGTELDLKGNARIQYEFQKLGPIGPFQPYIADQTNDSGSFNNDIDAKIFNNIYFGIGAEKAFGKLALQAKAYDNFTLKDVNYRKKNRLGVEVGLYYKL